MKSKQIEKSLLKYGEIVDITEELSKEFKVIKTYCMYFHKFIPSNDKEDCEIYVHCYCDGTFIIDKGTFPVACVTTEQFFFIEEQLKEMDFFVELTTYFQYQAIQFKGYAKSLAQLVDLIAFVRNLLNEFILKYGSYSKRTNQKGILVNYL